MNETAVFVLTGVVMVASSIFTLIEFRNHVISRRIRRRNPKFSYCVEYMFTRVHHRALVIKEKDLNPQKIDFPQVFFSIFRYSSWVRAAHLLEFCSVQHSMVYPFVLLTMQSISG